MAPKPTPLMLMLEEEEEEEEEELEEELEGGEGMGAVVAAAVEEEAVEAGEAVDEEVVWINSCKKAQRQSFGTFETEQPVEVVVLELLLVLVLLGV